jgi:hypothetical protein
MKHAVRHIHFARKAKARPQRRPLWAVPADAAEMAEGLTA